MRKTVFVVFLLALGPLRLKAEESYSETLERSPWLAPEMCALSDPDSFYHLRLSEEPQKVYVNGSEAGQDGFFAAYADNLRKFTDAHYPEAKKVRKLLYEAFWIRIFRIHQ